MEDLAIDGLQLFARVAARGSLSAVAQWQPMRVLPHFVDAQPVPIFAMTASARHRLPKIKACPYYCAQWSGAAVAASPHSNCHEHRHNT